jgi:glyoxylase-like metal-dependent hydrolase (beta-lactamase superfamily II)
MYRINKALYHSVPVEIIFEGRQPRFGPFEMLHVPGHCAGALAIRLHDVLFSGDHVLARTTPHQSPERLTLSTGLWHYLESLDRVVEWAGDVRLTLGGHEEPIEDLPARVEEIRRLHHLRLEKVCSILKTPHSVAEVSQALFGEVNGYNVLLAIEEAGAHVEYLYQRGRLGMERVEEGQRRVNYVLI